jgi:hypothetical protein
MFGIKRKELYEEIEHVFTIGNFVLILYWVSIVNVFLYVLLDT